MEVDTVLPTHCEIIPSVYYVCQGSGCLFVRCGRGIIGEMPLYFDQFQLDDLPIDWLMILVGWRGFGFYRRKLSVDQVIAHALEQIW